MHYDGVMGKNRKDLKDGKKILLFSWASFVCKSKNAE